MASSSVKVRVPFVDLKPQLNQLKDEIAAAIEEVLRRADFILGRDVEEFEEQFASYCGVRHAIGVDTGLSALEIALRCDRVGPGAEVITQANTFIATVAAITSTGATPVLVDCNESGAIDVAAVEAAITPQTRAVIPVHMYGQLSDTAKLIDIAAERGLVIIEDACQAHGAQIKGKRAGSFGRTGAFSFYPSKNLGGLGDGGALVTNSDEIADEARKLRNYGSVRKYEHVTTPMNRRLDSLQAAVLSVKLGHLDAWNGRRQYLADAYRERLESLPVKLAPRTTDGSHVYHLFVIRVSDRDALKNDLADAGIETGIHYPIPLHEQPVLKALGYGPGAFPISESWAREGLSLPMYPEMPLDFVDRVCRAIELHYA